MLKVCAGSVVVDVEAPVAAARDLHRQSLQPNSRLRTGKLTRFTDSITLPRGQVNLDPQFTCFTSAKVLQECNTRVLVHILTVTRVA